MRPMAADACAWRRRGVDGVTAVAPTGWTTPEGMLIQPLVTAAPVTGS
jgi:hypothetical protein